MFCGVVRPTGSLKVVWYEIDGVGGSITPMVFETANIDQRSRTVCVYVDSKDDIAIFGVWRVTQSYGGSYRGFSTFVGLSAVAEGIMCLKLEAMVEGARLASDRLF